MISDFGYARVSTCSIKVEVGNPDANCAEIAAVFKNIVDNDDSQIIVMPELCVSGYTCGDLFAQERLLDSVEGAVERIKKVVGKQLLLIGAPVRVRHALYNCAIVINEGKILGIVPKQFLPNYKEFYESRWFKPGDTSKNKMIDFAGQKGIPFGTNQLFQASYNSDRRGFSPTPADRTNIIIGIDVCEDMFMPVPPSSNAAIAGATILCNLSASPEQVTKNEYRRDLVKQQSGRCVAGYVYSSAGPSESTTDLTFGGHCIISENATVLEESTYVGDGSPPRRDSYWVTADVDVSKLSYDRRTQTSFFNANSSNEYQTVDAIIKKLDNHAVTGKLFRRINGHPFVPRNPAILEARCAEIYGIQVCGLAKRLEQIGNSKLAIGESGGVDSTHALEVLIETCELLNIPLDRIAARTMPGFGTGSKTKNNAIKLMELHGLDYKIIDIRPSCFQTFRDLNYHPFGIDPHQPFEDFEAALALLPANATDVQFENIQARRRTELLMAEGFVIGTGDLSEIALGWCTYNADHMSMYNVNCSIPKTLIKFLIEHVATTKYNGQALEEVLVDIANTVISPELLPAGKEGITHDTEAIIGPYELNDFFLFNFIRNGFSPEKILFLASFADFDGFQGKNYHPEFIKETLKGFYKRFFQNQFKRSCVPDGPKVGSVSLSPRGDWRMPSDADPSIWLNEL